MRQKLLATLAATLTLALHPPGSRAAEVPLDQWDGQRAMGRIADLLRFTPRAIDTPGHEQAIDYIKAEMGKTSADVVTTQRWTFKDSAGASHAMTNIIARFQPSNPHRVIVATHYDSIVRAYRDARSPDAPMPGANNSASGVAVLLETARVLSLMPKPAVGIDMIFFDGEEGPKALGAGDPNWMAIGSPYFVHHLHDYYPAQKPEKAVVLDMVCDKDLELQPEPSSLALALPEVKKFWTAGAAIAPKAFSTKSTSYPISDDHTALNGAGIPSFLVIDFEYEPYFNTTQDTIDKCSVDSLQAVGRTLLQYLYLP
ncbi:M28 family peptidase [Bradyrhizobium sp. Tv2a-2]|uniref:M28 family peptidase n=1 Tax=Bradyrhizobium sp. Tv2a-2 TaxID=113395 RepID=UPI0003F5C2E6|nr:M28 family peptidase [Bradyrhizobium sp. Tv2a-2]